MDPGGKLLYSRRYPRSNPVTAAAAAAAAGGGGGGGGGGGSHGGRCALYISDDQFQINSIVHTGQSIEAVGSLANYFCGGCLACPHGFKFPALAGIVSGVAVPDQAANFEGGWLVLRVMLLRLFPCAVRRLVLQAFRKDGKLFIVTSLASNAISSSAAVRGRQSDSSE